MEMSANGRVRYMARFLPCASASLPIGREKAIGITHIAVVICPITIWSAPFTCSAKRVQ